MMAFALGVLAGVVAMVAMVLVAVLVRGRRRPSLVGELELKLVLVSTTSAHGYKGLLKDYDPDVGLRVVAALPDPVMVIEPGESHWVKFDGEAVLPIGRVESVQLLS